MSGCASEAFGEGEHTPRQVEFILYWFMDLLAQTELAEQSRATSRIPSFYSCLWEQERIMLET